MARFLSIALLSFCYILSAQADIYSASSALSRGDYETAVAEFTKLAEKGDASAQANLGYMYYAGEGVPQDYEKAVYWYRKAATQGNKDAQYNLAVSYAFGEGAKQDLTEAAIWYRRAGEQGHVVSQYSLGISYAYGEGVPQDQKEAAVWFKKAADQGYARAQVQLGSMYHTGEGVEQDYLEASRWYRLAADRGDATAQYNLGTMYRSGKGVEQDYAQAKRWFRQSADQGYAAAVNELASLERSAAANVATRTIQAKPELPSVTETVPEPEPVKKAEPIAKVEAKPIEEKVAVQKTEPKEVEVAQTTSSEVAAKKPLFSVEKEGLLSLDEAELDIAEPEVVLEPKVEEKVAVQTKEPEKIVAAETSTEKTEIAKVVEPVTDSSAIHNALGLSAPKAIDDADAEVKSSDGFFDKLFAKKDSPKPDTTVTETVSEPIKVEPVVKAEPTPEPKIKKEVVITPRVYPEDIKAAELAAIEAAKPTPVVEAAVEQAPEEVASKETKSSGGFFDKLFGKKESTEPDATLTEEIAEPIKEEPVVKAEPIPEPKIKKEVVITPRVYPEDIKAAEVIETEPAQEKVVSTETEIANVSETKSDDNVIQKALGLPSPTTNKETEAPGSFFDKLFSSNESSETNPTPTTEVIADTVEVEPVVEEIIPEPEIVEEPIEQGNSWGKTASEIAKENEEKEKSSGGLFSAIGSFFSGGDNKEQVEINNTETESEDVLIAKLEEPVAVVEEVELAQEAETDLNKYSVHAGRRALTNNDYDEALKQFKPLAEAGDSEAQSHLGSLYYVGKGVNKDLTEAYNWYKKSADQGNMDAQYSVGNMYLLGEGVEQNNADATKWYTLASEQGHVAAKNNLKSLEKLEALNRENQLKLDAMAAEQKAKEAAIPEAEVASEEIASLEEQTTAAEPVAEEKSGLIGLLGGLFGSKSPETETKEEIESNIETSTEVIEVSNEVDVVELEPAKSNNNTYAVEETPSTETLETVIDEETTQSNNIASTDTQETVTPASKSESPGFFQRLFGSNDEVDSIAPETTEEIETSEEIAMLDVETTQSSNNVESAVAVEELTKEPKSEFEQLRPLATQGDQEAQYKLGGLYYSGSNVKQDYAQAALWYRRAAQQGNVDAQFSLGNMFLMGEGIEQDDNQAAHWYELAAEQGHSSAKHNLENLKNVQASSPQVEIETTSTTNSGQLISLDDQTSETTSIDDTTGKAEYEQGLAYAFGDGVPQNDRTAFNLFYESAEKGYVLAQYKIGVAFAYGEGVRQDQKKAAEWYRKAAEQGHTIAQRNLATMYLDGKGVEQNKVQALAWYQVVANAGNAMDLRRRDMLKQELSEVELIESQQLSEQISGRITNPSL